MQEDFGQEVILTVHSKSLLFPTGEHVLFDSTGLRVDFDVRLVDGFNRGTFVLYNLSDETIKTLANGDNYVTVRTRLHNQPYFTVADSFYISNVMEEKKLPESITTLYCYDSLRKEHLETPLDLLVYLPTLTKIVSSLMSASGFNGTIEFKNFPEGLIDQGSGRSTSAHQGSLQQCLRKLQQAYRFKLYTDKNKFLLLYLPNLNEVQFTKMISQKADVILDTRNMRSNPKIGPATLLVTSNLDGRIKPGALLDTTELVTRGLDVDPTGLEVAVDFLNHAVAGYSKYQSIAVQHTGSNYTSEWKTVATSVSPTSRTTMPILNWQKGT